MNYQEVTGNLIRLAQGGMFDVVAHGCNCYCRMGAGIAPQMAKAFRADMFELEKPSYFGDINKLGQIGYDAVLVADGKKLWVVNCYSQYDWDSNKKPLDYEALTLCFRKMAHRFKGMHIGLPQIGCGLAGGDWEVVKSMIRAELWKCNVTVVMYDHT